jgi:hypothetical protein
VTTCLASSRSDKLRYLAPLSVVVLLSATWLAAVPARAADDTDALDLKSAPVEAAQAAQRPTKFFVEGALGSVDQRFGLGSHSLKRASLDLVHTARLTPGVRVVFSDRLDHIRPAEPGADRTLNSLREAYLSWADEGGTSIVEFGRINLRYGPAYGYNPTDFFRDGALRAVTTANPFSLRENRLGTVVLRGQRLWQSGSIALALSPKLANTPSGESFSLDLGATNHVSRGLLALSHQWSDRISGQLLFYKEAGLDVQTGANLTALLTDAIVAHGEWTHSREPRLADRAWGIAGRTSSAQRLAAGLTFTTSTKLSLTGEVQYNGHALGKSAWDQAASGDPTLLGAYLFEAARRQDLASRKAYLVYATQRDLGIKNLDLTALVRVNADDHSRMSWLELRYHWARVDLALQAQDHSGRPGSEFGLNPQRRSIQVLASVHF